MPCAATNALFDVVTCFPERSASLTNSNAGDVPPIVSTTTSISLSSIISFISCTTRLSHSLPANSRISRIFFTAISSPVFCFKRALFSFITSYTPEPTVPNPKIAILNIYYSLAKIFISKMPSKLLISSTSLDKSPVSFKISIDKEIVATPLTGIV